MAHRSAPWSLPGWSLLPVNTRCSEQYYSQHCLHLSLPSTQHLTLKNTVRQSLLQEALPSVELRCAFRSRPKLPSSPLPQAMQRVVILTLLVCFPNQTACFISPPGGWQLLIVLPPAKVNTLRNTFTCIEGSFWHLIPDTNENPGS